jgi:hypothetical protein
MVCGYDKLEDPQYYEDGSPSFTICSCCGYESGYDDLDQGETIESYRENWITKGVRWFDESVKPSDWNVELQLKNINK